MAILLWIIFTFISCFILYVVIKTAINHSVLATTESEIRNLQSQHHELIKQLELLRKTIADQNKGNNVDKKV
ncbi:hypothetical protein AWM70_14785 [Paenibacillus yonginensis]|uniref:Uncharacterized protein n=1 Tax=Paenibacillus yonginensis TaxID=1462996 RepID=A0A1B1N2S0_9BACL|nr:hypothetical protein [Paenibacillus yonginensis]ANS75709.1 hypothetical protein AWM70_14785 [Paenibacillus yonginensis]